ncbi:MAG: sulfatase-like hydrolase/transferase [Phycisphaerae bacterium]
MPENKPNMVLIVADQWRGDCLSGIGSRHPVMTPHISQLGCEGARFSNAYADCPICMPQRVTHLTGQVASRFGQPGNFHRRLENIDPKRTLPARLARQAGYQTQAVGKMHFFPPRARFGFDHVNLHPNDYVNFLETVGWGGAYRGHGIGGNEVYPVSAQLPERYTHTHWIVDRACEFLLRRDPECPFFLYVVFEAPHSPFDPPAPYDRMYDNFHIPEPIDSDWSTGDQAPAAMVLGRAQYNYDHLTDEIIAEARRRYYGQISHIDYQLGRLIGQLKTLGLYDDTAVVFTSDHGEHLGDHGTWHKGTFLRGSADVPLTMRLPGWVDGAPMAEVVDHPVLTADITATMFELAGLEPDETCDGISLLDTLRTGQPPRQFTCGEIGQTAFCTDGRYKYIWYVAGGAELLFDTAEDPEERVNLAGRGDHCEVQTRLRDQLIAYLQRFDRPMAAGGKLQAVQVDTGPDALRAARAKNPFANRGDMRYGQGYHGFGG